MCDRLIYCDAHKTESKKTKTKKQTVWLMAPACMRRVVRSTLGAMLLFTLATLQNAHSAPLHMGRDNSSSPWMLEKIASLRPFPVGVVFQQDPRIHHDLDTIRAEFALIRSLGFTALKQIMLSNKSKAFARAVFEAAIEEGLTPWWYGRAGWATITPELLDRLGIPTDTPPAAVQNDPRMVGYQKQVQLRRVARMSAFNPPSEPVPVGRYLPLNEAELPHFAAWLETQYGDVAALVAAWHMEASIDPDPTQTRLASTIDLDAPANFTAAAALLAMPGLEGPSWAEGPGFFAPWGFSAADRDFRRYMDAMRFRGEMHAANERAAASASRAWDPDAPMRCGGETMLLSNQPHNGWWRQGLAEVAAEFGGFYDSMHLPWHYILGNERLNSPEVANIYDVDITVQILARAIFSDLRYPNQWAGAFESTGGPAILSGGQGMTVDAAQIRRLMLTYAATGLKGIGLWAWNSRWHGLEGGEYSLTDRQGLPSDRAIEAGKVAAALQASRFELWDATELPLVGILRSYTNEAVWARLGSSMILPVSCAVSGCADRQRERPYRPTKSMLGYARVLSALSIPWRFLSEEQLGDPKFGAMNLSMLIIPAAVALNRSTLPLILQYVDNGGHVIADQPFVLFDEVGNTVDHAKTAIPNTFGTFVQDYFDTSNGYERTATLKSGKSLSVHGIYGRIATDKKNANWTVETDGWVSRASNRRKSGAATFFNYELGQKLFGETQRLRFDPGASFATSELQAAVLSCLGNRMPWMIESNTIAPVVIRRKVREDDFLFVMNRAATPCSALLVMRQTVYEKIVDVLDANASFTFNNHHSNFSVTIALELRPGEMIWLRAMSLR